MLLHPGGVDSRVLASLVPDLATSFEVFRPDRRGHGRTPDVGGPLSYEVMAHDTAMCCSPLLATEFVTMRVGRLAP